MSGHQSSRFTSNQSSRDIELSELDFQTAHLSAKNSPQGRTHSSRSWQKSGRHQSRKKSSSHNSASQQGYRDPFAPNSRYCRYHHRHCVYDYRLRKCREQLTPVAEVSTPESSSSGKLSSASVCSRPGTPIGIPGRAKAIPTPEYSDDHTEHYEGQDSLPEYDDNQDRLPGYVPENDGVTTLKATATVTLELTSSSPSQPFRVVRMQHSK